MGVELNGLSVTSQMEATTLLNPGGYGVSWSNNSYGMVPALITASQQNTAREANQRCDSEASRLQQSSGPGQLRWWWAPAAAKRHVLGHTCVGGKNRSYRQYWSSASFGFYLCVFVGFFCVSRLCFCLLFIFEEERQRRTSFGRVGKQGGAGRHWRGKKAWSK